MRDVICSNCGKKRIRRDVYPVLSLDGQVTVSFVCSDCFKIVEVELKDLMVDSDG